MKLVNVLLVFFSTVIVLTFNTQLFAIDLVSPPQDTEVHVGDTITIKVVPSQGEDLFSVSFGGGFANEVFAPPYEYQYKIKPNNIGNIRFSIIGLTKDEKFSEITLRLKSTLPSTTVLQGIRVRDDQRKLFMTVGETDNFYLYGQFSDGVERNISVGFGTTSQSTDERVAIFNEKGKIVGLSVGKATVTIKNGSHEIKVPVFVDK